MSFFHFMSTTSIASCSTQIYWKGKKIKKHGFYIPTRGLEQINDAH